MRSSSTWQKSASLFLCFRLHVCAIPRLDVLVRCEVDQWLIGRVVAAMVDPADAEFCADRVMRSLLASVSVVPALVIIQHVSPSSVRLADASVLQRELIVEEAVQSQAIRPDAGREAS